MKEQTPTLRSALFAVPILLVLGIYGLGGELSGLEQSYLARAADSIAHISASLYSPMYLILLKGWSSWLESPFWLRLPNLIAAIAALLLSNRMMRSSGGAHAAPGALLLLAAAPFLIGQVQLLSPSVLALVATMAALLCFVDYLRTGSHSWLGLWVLAMLFAFGVHSGLAYLLLVKWLYMLAYRDRFRNRQRLWWIAQIPVTGFFIAVFGTGVQPWAQRLIALPAAAPTDWTLLFAQMTIGVPRPAGLLGSGLLGLLLLCGIWASRDWRRDTRHGLLLLGALTPCCLYFSPIGHASFGLAALPFLCTLVSMGMRLFPRWGRQALWAAVAMTYLYGYWYIFD
jgi:hypothetical protein